MGLWQSQFTCAQSPVDPKCPLHQCVPSCLSPSRESLLLVSEAQARKAISLPFLLCLHGLPELPFLPGKQQVTPSIANIYCHEEFFLPSLDQVGAALIPASAFGKHLWRNPSLPSLAFPDQIGDVPDPVPSILGNGNAEKENINCRVRARYEWQAEGLPAPGHHGC